MASVTSVNCATVVPEFIKFIVYVGPAPVNVALVNATLLSAMLSLSFRFSSAVLLVPLLMVVITTASSPVP